MISQAITGWTAIALYAVASAALIVGLIFARDGAVRWATGAAWTGLAAHTAFLALRWNEVGHGPYLNLYEVGSANSWVAVALLLGGAARQPRLLPAGAAVLPASFLLFGVAMLSSSRPLPLLPILDSAWLVLHACFAKLTYGAYLVATAVAALYLIKDGRPGVLERAPALPILEDLLHRFVLLGFVMHSLMIATGAVWSQRAFGHHWAWDPIETWAFISWICYGVFLHARALHGWRGRRLALLACACFAAIVCAFFGVPYLYTTSHNLFLR